MITVNFSTLLVFGLWLAAAGMVFGIWPGVRNQLFGEGNINLCLVV